MGGHVGGAAACRVDGLRHRREQADEPVAEADAGDHGAAVGHDRTGDDALDLSGAAAVVRGAELLGEAGGVDDVGEEDDRFLAWVR